MRTENLFFTLVSVGYVAAQTSFITTKDASGHTLVITEIQSTLGVSGPTETIQILDIGAGITLTETLIVSPTHVSSIEDINLPGEVEHMRLDCNIDPNGLGHCTESISAAQGASTIQTVITFETQFAAPPPAPSSAPSSGSQASNKPSGPTSSSAAAQPSNSQSTNSPASTPSSSASVNAPSSTSSSTSSGATPTGTSSSTPTGLTTTTSSAATTPTASSTNTDDSPTTVTSPGALPTNGTLSPPPDNSAASMGGVNTGSLVFIAFLGLTLGMM